MKKIYITFTLCVLVATILALTSHIYIAAWVQPTLSQMLQGFQSNAVPKNTVVLAAYGTAFFTAAVLAFVYYHTNHLLPIKNKVIKVMIVAAIILELKGYLIRQPLMDWLYNSSLGMPSPLIFVVLNHADKWVANLLLAFSLVYLCPRKKVSIKR